MARAEDIEFVIRASTETLRTDLAKGTAEFQKFSKQTQGQFDEINRGVGHMVRGFREAFSVVGVAFGVHAFEGWVRSSIDAQKAAGNTTAAFTDLLKATKDYSEASSQLGIVFGELLTPAIRFATHALIGWKAILGGGELDEENQKLAEMQSRLADLNKQLRARSDTPAHREELRQQIAALQDEIDAQRKIALAAMDKGGPDTTLDQYKNELDVLKQIAAEQKQIDAGSIDQYNLEIQLQKELNDEKFGHLDEETFGFHNLPGEAIRQMPQLFDGAVDEMSRSAKQFAQDFGRGLHNSLVDFIVDGHARFSDFIRRLAAEVAVSGIFNIFAKVLGGSTSPAGQFFSNVFGGARALGGPVTAGSSYLVGEQGPEIFTPSMSGNIAAHGGGPTVIQNINVQADDVTIESRMAIATRVAASAAYSAVMQNLGGRR